MQSHKAMRPDYPKSLTCYILSIACHSSVKQRWSTSNVLIPRSAPDGQPYDVQAVVSRVRLGKTTHNMPFDASKTYCCPCHDLPVRIDHKFGLIPSKRSKHLDVGFESIAKRKHLLGPCRIPPDVLQHVCVARSLLNEL